MPRTHRPQPWLKWLRYLVGVIVLTVIVVQSLVIWQLYQRSEEQSATPLKEVLIDAIRSLNKPFAVEPTTGRQFIPSAHLVLPADTGRLAYRDGDGDTLWFIDTSNQAQAISNIRTAKTLKDVFRAVETAQICSRQLIAGLDQKNPDPGGDKGKLVFVSAKTLKDGRIIYFYENNGCPYGPEALTRALTRVESF